MLLSQANLQWNLELSDREFHRLESRQARRHKWFPTWDGQQNTNSRGELHGPYMFDSSSDK